VRLIILYCDNRALNEIIFHVQAFVRPCATSKSQRALDMQNSKHLVHYEVALLNHDTLIN